MTTSGQTINDRFNAVRYALVGQGLARTVCKATTEEVIGPKRKHIDYLIAYAAEPNVSIPEMANLLFERTQHTSWAVVFKGLITIHQLMCEANERFNQFLATSNHLFNLEDFMDRSTPQGYAMSGFVRNYAKYVNEKILSYRALAIDLCKIRQGDDNVLRTMNMDNLGKTLPIVQSQFDALLNFGTEPKDLNNGIIMAAYKLLYKDLCKIYVAYQEAIINLLERYFKLSRKKTRDALSLYKEYLNRMDKVSGFLKVVNAVGLDKSDMPDLTNKPASILPALENHLAQLEAKKKGGAAGSSTPIDEGNKTDSPLSQKSHSDGKKDENVASDLKPEISPTLEPPKPPKPPNKLPQSSPAKPPPPVNTHALKQHTPEKKKHPPSRPAPPTRPPPPSSSSNSPAKLKPSHHVGPPVPPPPPTIPHHKEKQQAKESIKKISDETKPLSSSEPKENEELKKEEINEPVQQAHENQVISVQPEMTSTSPKKIPETELKDEEEISTSIEEKIADALTRTTISDAQIVRESMNEEEVETAKSLNSLESAADDEAVSSTSIQEKSVEDTENNEEISVEASHKMVQ